MTSTEYCNPTRAVPSYFGIRRSKLYNLKTQTKPNKPELTAIYRTEKEMTREKI